uniref:Selenoprotein P2 n=1 Tax=Callorhinchus milii TaxID=7868 RepID=A0A4W3HTY3_CALMI
NAVFLIVFKKLCCRVVEAVVMELGVPLLTVLLGLVLIVSGEKQESRICQAAPLWEIANQNPMEQQLGSVVVVALLKASCQFCLTQAAKLGSLQDKLARQGLKDVHYMIVNEKAPESRAMLWELKRHVPNNVSVYQQSPIQPDVWHSLQGGKDDFLIYDRCGRLTFHVVLPYSSLQYPYIEAAIRATHKRDICGECTITKSSLEMDRNVTTTPSRHLSPNTSD